MFSYVLTFSTVLLHIWHALVEIFLVLAFIQNLFPGPASNPQNFKGSGIFCCGLLPKGDDLHLVISVSLYLTLFRGF
jgi:hypothetical protein